MTETIIVKDELDTCGLSCPLPLLKTKQALSTLASGEVLKVMTTDASSQRDFRSFARISNNELINETHEDGIYYYWLKKG